MIKTKGVPQISEDSKISDLDNFRDGNYTVADYLNKAEKLAKTGNPLIESMLNRAKFIYNKINLINSNLVKTELNSIGVYKNIINDFKKHYAIPTNDLNILFLGFDNIRVTEEPLTLENNSKITIETRLSIHGKIKNEKLDLPVKCFENEAVDLSKVNRKNQNNYGNYMSPYEGFHVLISYNHETEKVTLERKVEGILIAKIEFNGDEEELTKIRYKANDHIEFTQYVPSLNNLKKYLAMKIK